MLLKRPSQISWTSYDKAVGEAQFIFLEPWVPNRSYFLAQSWGNVKSSVRYWAVSTLATSTRAWLQEGVNTLRAQRPDFGEHLAEALTQSNPVQWGRALARDCALGPDEPRLLVWDALGYQAPDSAHVRFFEAFLAAIPASLRVMVNARLAYRAPWHDLWAQGRAAMIRGQLRFGRGQPRLVFQRQDALRDQIEGHGLQGGRAFKNGEMVTPWGGMSRELFFRQLQAPVFTAKDVSHDLWSDETTNAQNNLHVQRSKLKQLLQVEIAPHRGSFYQWSDDCHIHYDVADFLELLDLAMQTVDTDLQMVLYRQAEGLYRDDFLSDVHNAWAKAKRARLRERYAEVLFQRGHHALWQENLSEAARRYERALQYAPTHETIVLSLMSAYTQLDNRDGVRRTYEHHAQELGKRGRLPSAFMRDWLAFIRSWPHS